MSCQRRAFARQQRGAVLAVALIILLMVSVLGLSAMRASIFSNKVSTGVQADTMSFDAAESAVVRTMTVLKGLTKEELAAGVLNGQVLQNCLQSDGVLRESACTGQDVMDSRGLLRSGTYVIHRDNDCRVVPGYDVEEFRDYVISTLGESEMPSYGIANHHLQEALQMGPGCLEI